MLPTQFHIDYASDSSYEVQFSAVFNQLHPPVSSFVALLLIVVALFLTGLWLFLDCPGWNSDDLQGMCLTFVSLHLLFGLHFVR